MTRQEFMDTLGRTLRRELSEQEVLDNLQYYEDYIDREVRSGKSEEQVLAGLGDPRLIARTILQVDEQREETAAQGYESRETVFTEDEDGTFRESYDKDRYGGEDIHFDGRVKVHRMGAKGWLILILVLVIICAVLGTVFAVLWKLLPVILVVGAVYWVYKKISS